MKLLTVKNLSNLIGVKEKTLYQWAELGQIPHVKLNGCLRFDFSEIEEWIRSCKKESGLGYNPLTQARGPKKGVDK